MNQPRYTLSMQDVTAVRASLQRKLATPSYWLDADPWRTLKAAVRAARKRRRDRTGPRNPPVNVTLSRQAWFVLSDLARHEGLTLSDWLIHRHYAAWLKL